MVQQQELQISAIQTTTRYSFPRYKELVNQYVAYGMTQIFIRPLTPLGYAEQHWDSIGYSPEEFLDFYKNILEYIIQLNKNGTFIAEGHAKIF